MKGGSVLQGRITPLLAAAGMLLSSAALAEEPTRQVQEEASTTVEQRRELTLGQALALADERNLTLAQARSELARAEAQVRQTYAVLIPSASAGMTYTRLDHADELDTSAMMGGAPGGGGDTIVIRRQDDLAGALTVRVPLVNPAAWAGIAVSRKAAEVAESSVEQARRAVLYGTAQAFHVALVSRALVDLQEEQIHSATHHLEVAERKETAGSGLRIDVLRARTDLEQARQDLENARLSLDTACDALGVLTGTGGLPLPVAAPEMVAPDLDEHGLEKGALVNRRDLAVLKKSRELTNDQLTAAWMALLPTLNATWQGTHQFTEMSAMGDQDETRWSAMLTLSVPLFDWGSYGAIGVQRAALERASAQLAEAEQKAGQEVRQARREYLSALRTAENAEMKAELAREALALATSAYESGAGTSLEVTDARRTATAAEVGAVTSRLQAQLSLLALLQAAGTSPDDIFTSARG